MCAFMYIVFTLSMRTNESQREQSKPQCVFLLFRIWFNEHEKKRKCFLFYKARARKYFHSLRGSSEMSRFLCARFIKVQTFRYLLWHLISFEAFNWCKTTSKRNTTFYVKFYSVHKLGRFWHEKLRNAEREKERKMWWIVVRPCSNELCECMWFKLLPKIVPSEMI